MRHTRSAVMTAAAVGLLGVLIHNQTGTQSSAAPSPSPLATGSGLIDDQALHPATTTSTTPPTALTVPPPTTPPAPTAAPRSPAPRPAAPRTTTAPAPITADPASEARALQLVNQERARAGLSALQLNSGATSVARSWSRWMAGHSLVHNPNLARDLERAGVTGWHTIGENVGNGPDADRVHAMFMASGSHRANILSNQFSAVGIGAVRRDGQVWITMDFVGW